MQFSIFLAELRGGGGWVGHCVDSKRAKAQSWGFKNDFLAFWIQFSHF